MISGLYKTARYLGRSLGSLHVCRYVHVVDMYPLSTWPYRFKVTSPSLVLFNSSGSFSTEGNFAERKRLPYLM